jgi:adenylate cyclase
VTAEPPDPVFEAIEFGILGQDRDLTRLDVQRLSGETFDRIDALWRALGFTTAGDHERVYTAADLEALNTLVSLVEIGFIDPGAELALARSMGRSFARLAEWEVGVMADLVLADAHAESLEEVDLEAVKELIARTLPAVEQLQDYVWRRHLAAAAGRILLHPQSAESAAPMAIGFADIVGFTRRSRELDAEQLAELVENFEQQVSLVITHHDGRVIKTIGDEVLFAADDPIAAGRIAIALAGRHAEDEDFPEVRVGAAYGDVLSRLGDVFGEVVNIAARLTSIARPGRALVDRGLATTLEEHPDEFRVRRTRTTSVKGYSRLECYALRTPKPMSEESRLPDPIEDVLDNVVEAISDRLPASERRKVRSKPEKRDRQEP